jgi:hypothetical protein
VCSVAGECWEHTVSWGREGNANHAHGETRTLSSVKQGEYGNAGGRARRGWGGGGVEWARRNSAVRSAVHPQRWRRKLGRRHRPGVVRW